MKLTVPLAIVTLLLTTLPPLSACAESAQPLRWVVADQVRVRTGATTADPVSGSLSRGAELILKVPAGGDFCFVEGEGLTGYVACKYLSSERVSSPKSGENGIDAQQRWVSGNGVTLRDKPDINASATGRLLLNSIVKLLNTDAGSGYCEVTAEGLSGFMACRYLASSPVVSVNFQANKNVEIQPAITTLSSSLAPTPMSEKVAAKRQVLLDSLDTVTAAKKVTIGTIPKKYCDGNSDNYNDQIYTETKSDSSQSLCVLTYLRPSSYDPNFEYESKALMNINGTIIYLNKNKDSGMLETDDGSVYVVLNVNETGTTCVPGEDKCCGSDYAGTLSVTTAAGKASVRVSYYRGG